MDLQLQHQSFQQGSSLSTRLGFCFILRCFPQHVGSPLQYSRFPSSLQMSTKSSLTSLCPPSRRWAQGGPSGPVLPPQGPNTGMEAQSFCPSSLGSLDRKKRFSSSRGSMTPEGGTTSLCPAFLESRDRKEWLSLTPPLLRCSPRGAGTGGCLLCSLCSFRSFSSPSGHRSCCCRRCP